MICVSVLADTNRKALGMMEKGFRMAGMVELRIDRIGAPDLRTLVAARRGRLLATNRSKKEGGFFPGPEGDRVALLSDAVRLGADFVDVEASTNDGLLTGLVGKVRSQRGKAKLIVSSHEFKGTPSWRSLLRKLEACRAFEPDIVKIVTHAGSVEDNLRVLQLIPHSRGKGQPIIAFCMGPKGRISRLLAPILGSCLSYASLGKGSESAPGQLSVSEMRRVWRLLRWNPKTNQTTEIAEDAEYKRCARLNYSLLLS